jgi:hypothetical protein
MKIHARKMKTRMLFRLWRVWVWVVLVLVGCLQNEKHSDTSLDTIALFDTLTTIENDPPYSIIHTVYRKDVLRKDSITELNRLKREVDSLEKQTKNEN